MSVPRINHKNHHHANTPAARAKCRAELKKFDKKLDDLDGTKSNHFAAHNVKPKGSKVVHRTIEGPVKRFVCTTKEVKEDAEVAAAPVTCKNCLKQINATHNPKPAK